ncbi:MAG: class I SAM-dependent methyltransferase [Pseudomonadota bacterium]
MAALEKTEAARERRLAGSIEWGDYARSYDVMAKYNLEYLANMEMAERVITQQFPGKTVTICDIAAGTGNYINFLLSRGLLHSATHIDASLAMNAIALEKYSAFDSVAVDVRTEPAEALSFLEEIYDVYLCCNALYAIAERDSVVRAITRSMGAHSVVLAIDFGREMKTADWTLPLLNAAFSKSGFRGVAELLASSREIARHNRHGGDVQKSGGYWLHDLSEFTDLFVSNGLDLIEAGVCYRGYCDYVVARR